MRLYVALCMTYNSYNAIAFYSDLMQGCPLRLQFYTLLGDFLKQAPALRYQILSLIGSGRLTHWQGSRRAQRHPARLRI